MATESPDRFMKLLIVTRETHADKRYGLGKSLAPLVVALQRRGLVCGYLCRDELGERARRWQLRLQNGLARLAPLFPGSDFSMVAQGVLERLNMGRLAARVAVRDGYTHVHCQDPLIAVGYRWAVRWSLTACRPAWGVFEHGFGSYIQAFPDEGIRMGATVTRLLRRLERKTLMVANWVLTPTASGRTQLVRDLALSVPPPHFQVVPHALAGLHPQTREEARATMGWDRNGLYILAVGRLVGLKRFERLIAAFALLPSHARLVILGEGNTHPLHRAARQHGVSERLTITAIDEIASYYFAADIYVSTSATESFGLANLEAMEAGLPMVCTAVGAVPEVVGEAAWLLGGYNCEGLEGALQRLAGDSSERRQWAARAVRRSACWPQLDAIVDGLMGAFRGEAVPVLIPPPQADEPFPQHWHRWAETISPCPLPQSLQPPSKSRVLLFAPHADDEVIGCGGSLARFAGQGATIQVVALTDGALGDPAGHSGSVGVVAERRAEMERALAELGVTDCLFLDEPDGSYRHHPRLAQCLDEIWRGFQPEWVFIPSLLDLHRDHVSAALSLLELWVSRGARERLLLYEVWTALPINRVMEISATMERKRRALEHYRVPLEYYDYLTYSDGLNHYRGASLAPFGAIGEGFLELTAANWREALSHLAGLRGWLENDLCR